MKTESYLIGGMHCAACSASVERVTRAIKGVAESNVNLTTEKMTITYDETLVTPEMIIKEVEGAGFDIELFQRSNSQSAPKPSSSKKEKDENPVWPLVIAGVFAAGLLYLCMGPMLFGIKINMPKINLAITEMLLALCIMFIGRRYFESGIKSLLHKAPNMDSLVAISCLCSFIYSLVQTYKISYDEAAASNLYYESCGVVLFFIMLGKTLEARSKKKTKDAIEGLANLAADTAMLVVDGDFKEIPVSELQVGDTVMISSGNRVPSDAEIVKGSADFDESMFTGESIPVHKGEGEKIIGGTILTDGSVVYAEITSIGEDTTLAGIIRFVEDAQGKKAPISSLADKVAGIFVPSVMAIACIAAIIWALLGKDINFVLRIFTTVLVIACPCALGLATPTALICGTGLGARNGILIRSGEALESASNIDTVVLDKTGTLTVGSPMVYGIKNIDCEKEDVLRVAASVEMYSDHPLARAVFEEAKKLGLNTKDKLEEFEYISGRGIVAESKNGERILAGNAALLSEHSVSIDAAKDFSDKAFDKGQSIIYISVNEKLIGAISLFDTIKPSSKKLIENLHEMNIKPVLLTGDNEKAARSVANELGIENVIAEVLPKDKATVVEKLKAEGSKVMMVGDGINDAPALAASDVGCAIGSGSDIAVDSADIVLMKDDPVDVSKAIKLSKMTIRNIKQNLFWAFFYNCIGIPIAAGVLFPINGMLLTPMIGGLAMSFSSVFVVSNALRLRTMKL